MGSVLGYMEIRLHVDDVKANNHNHASLASLPGHRKSFEQTVTQNYFASAVEHVYIGRHGSQPSQTLSQRAALRYTKLLLCPYSTRLLFIGLSLPEQYPNKPHITFKNDGSFKLTVFSDLHFGENPWNTWGPEQDRKSTRLLSTVLEDERPDFA